MLRTFPDIAFPVDWLRLYFFAQASYQLIQLANLFVSTATITELLLLSAIRIILEKSKVTSLFISLHLAFFN